MSPKLEIPLIAVLSDRMVTAVTSDRATVLAVILWKNDQEKALDFKDYGISTFLFSSKLKNLFLLKALRKCKAVRVFEERDVIVPVIYPLNRKIIIKNIQPNKQSDFRAFIKELLQSFVSEKKKKKNS